MWKLWCGALLVMACGGEEEPPGLVGSRETITVQLHWSWVRHLSPLPGCTKGVQSCTGCEGSCASSPGCSVVYKEHCCDATKEIYASGRSKVLADFARCSISEPAQGLLNIDCPVDVSTPVFHVDEIKVTHMAGTSYQYTGGHGCTWSPPYPGP